jgi:hypothetical protein
VFATALAAKHRLIPSIWRKNVEHWPHFGPHSPMITLSKT